MWDIDIRYIRPWLDSQDEETIAHIFSALEVLQREGPALGRPLVDSVQASSLANLKELRPPTPGRAEVRILFVFDPRRRAILLVAGDKGKARRVRDKWSGWYRRAIPQAEEIYSQYLRHEREAHE